MSWVEVSNEQFSRMEVGKSFSFDGRVGRVVAKAEPSVKNSKGMVSGFPMVQVRWRA